MTTLQPKLALWKPKVKTIYKRIPVAKIHYLDIDDDVLYHIETVFPKTFNIIYVDMNDLHKYITDNSEDKYKSSYKFLMDFHNAYREFEYIIITFNSTSFNNNIS